MKLLMLGGSKAQLLGIRKAQALGHSVVLCDYLDASIGHNIADKSYLVSTFDCEGVLEVAKREKVDGIMTMGTDQPVYTGAYVSEILSLPTFLSTEVARLVTNKRFMKEKFSKLHIPTVEYVLYEKDKNDVDLKKFNGPVVIKPVDSQGQRGIYYLSSSNQVREYYEKVIEYSREKHILVESYYENNEITVSGWVHKDEVTVLTITDRVTFNNKDQLGICLSHEYPSKYCQQYENEIHELTKRIVDGFNIHEGPIYFQYLMGDEGLKVNEIAARVGGAYEGHFMPALTGFDMVEVQIKSLLGDVVDYSPLKKIKERKKDKFISVQLFFINPCTVKEMLDEEEVLAMNGVIECGFNIHEGDRIKSIENATARGGYIIVTGHSQKQLRESLINLYKNFKVIDENGANQLIHPDYKIM